MAERQVNYLVFVPVVILVLVIGAFGFKSAQNYAAKVDGRDPNSLPLAIQGQPVPPLTLDGLPGNAEFSTADLEKPGLKLVNFWASWCAPCRVEHPNLVALADEGLAIYGINYKDDPADALAFMNELGDPYTAVGADTRGRNGLNWGVIAMPETFVIDGNGNILLRHAGPLTQSVIERVIRPVLSEAPDSQ